MSQTNAAVLLSRYTQALDDALATVEPLTADDLRRQSPENQCSAAALVAHIAIVDDNVAGWIQTLAAGEALPPITMADIDRNNAEQAKRNDGLGKDELLARLRTSGVTMTSVLRALDDNDLTRSGTFTLAGGEIDVQTLIELAVLAHTAEHLASLRAAVGEATVEAQSGR